VTALAYDMAAALDPAELARRVGILPDDWQAEVLRSDESRILLNCCRQSGKSTVAALRAVHETCYVPGSLCLLVSPSLRQSQELFRKALGAYRVLGRPVPPEAENQLSLHLENGSRIESLPGKESTVRGFSGVRLIVVDEAARVPDELYVSLRPMLATSGGRLIALSTPFGTRGWWYDAWRSGGSWARFEVPAAEVSRISAEFLEEERRTLGPWFFAQEYECRFMEAETQAFRREDVERALRQEVEPWIL
jgi:hypothetical protein